MPERHERLKVNVEFGGKISIPMIMECIIILKGAGMKVEILRFLVACGESLIIFEEKSDII